MKYTCVLIHYIYGAYLQNIVVISNKLSREENFIEKKKHTHTNILPLYPVRT